MAWFIRQWNKRLNSMKKDDVEDFSFNGVRKIAKVVDVYDGDSITVIFKFNGNFQKFKIRMEGYDSPEMRSKDLLEKEYAQKAKQALSDLILNQLVRLECGKSDKYGRILGKVYTLENVCANDYMKHNKYGYVYDGGTKKKFDQLHDYYGVKTVQGP